MKRARLALTILSLAMLAASTVSKPSELKGYRTDEAAPTTTVHELPITGTIELGLAAFVERVLGRAEKGDVVILKIKTFGGRVDAAVRIRDALLDSKAHTVAYIDRRAISAGALISLACDTIIMSEGASIGAATPVQSGGDGEMKATSEKVVSYMRAEMRATAEAKGRRADIAEAMVDAEIEVKGVSDKGKLLTLTSTKAYEFKIANALVGEYSEVRELLNLGEATYSSNEEDWGETLARTLTDPTVSSLLMTFGSLGLLLEFYSPGFGFAGAAGITCLGLFFLGQYAANLAGWEELIILVAGVLFLALELLVIPGFGIAGLIGIFLMALAFGMSLIDTTLPFDVSFELGYLQEGLKQVVFQVGLAFIVTMVVAAFLARRFPQSRMGKLLIHDAEIGGQVQNQGQMKLLGEKGEALVDLRPAGLAIFDDKRMDVVSQGGFIDRGTTVEVVDVSGNRIVVRPART